MVSTASLLGAQQLWEVVENKPASSLVVSLGKAVNGTPPPLCGRQVAQTSRKWQLPSESGRPVQNIAIQFAFSWMEDNYEQYMDSATGDQMSWLPIRLTNWITRVINLKKLVSNITDLTLRKISLTWFILQCPIYLKIYKILLMIFKRFSEGLISRFLQYFYPELLFVDGEKGRRKFWIFWNNFRKMVVIQ